MQDARQILADVALPEPEHEPPFFCEFVVDFAGLLDVAREMADPVGLIVGNLFTGMGFVAAGVPEVPVDEDGDLLARQHDVGRAGKFAVILAVTDALMPEGFPEHHLRFRVPPANLGHDAAALGLGQGPARLPPTMRSLPFL